MVKKIFCISESSLGVCFIMTVSIAIIITTYSSISWHNHHVHGLSYPIHRHAQHIRHPQKRLENIQRSSSVHPIRNISHRHFPLSSLYAVSGFNDNDEDMEDSEGQRKLLEQMKNKELIQKLLMIPSFQSSPISSTTTDSTSTRSTTTSSGYSSSVSGGLIELNLLGQGSASVVTIREDARKDNADDNDISKKDVSTLPSLFLSPSYYCEQIQKEILLRQMDEQKQTLSSSLSSRSSPVSIPSLPIPLSNKKQIQLVSFAYKNKPISKSLCLTINPLLINRDNGLYDNLPWSTWTIDPLRRNRNVGDGKAIDAKFHLGKRDAYNRFLGKDWYGRSLSIGNLAARVKYFLESDSLEGFQEYMQTMLPQSNDDERGEVNANANADDGGSSSSSIFLEDEMSLDSTASFDDETISNLAKRIMMLELNEASSDLAQVEQDLAIHLSRKKDMMNESSSSSTSSTTTSGSSSSSSSTSASMRDWSETHDILQLKLQSVQDTMDDIQRKLQSLNGEDEDSEMEEDVSWTDKIKDVFSKFLERKVFSSFLERIVEENQSDAPYRGAMGYKPVIDSKQEMFETSILPYTSPFDLMNEIINEQFNAKVIGSIIENTSLVPGIISLGGGVVIQRLGRKKTININGETIQMDDSEDDYGNDGLRKGEVMIVECDCDEAIGMALTCDLDLLVERFIWEEVQADVNLGESIDSSFGLPAISTTRIDSTTPDEEGSDNDNDDDNDDKMFSTDNDNPIQSLAEYDALNREKKAKILMSLESFKGRLPRPRIINMYESETTEQKKKKNEPAGITNHPLDKLLIPLIDESVRNGILIRDAEERGDFDTAFELRQKMSKRQIAKENAEEAREVGEERLAEAYDEEADLYASLRADVTQDEGSYDRYLDKDEAYERKRLAGLKGLSKKNFGSLLDGIE